jgi:transcriptional regulator
MLTLGADEIPQVAHARDDRVVLIHEWDASTDDSEWRAFIDMHGFGDLVAGGRGRDLPVVVPTQFVLAGDEIVLHLVRNNPIWSAIDENPNVLLCVAGDWAFIPSSWKVVGDEDPALGIPTTYYAAVQIAGRATVLGEPDDVASVLRAQLGALQPEVEVVDPSEHGVRLRAITGMRIEITDVRAKFKYGGNVDRAHRDAVAERLEDRSGPGDAAALTQLRRRIDR